MNDEIKNNMENPTVNKNRKKLILPLAILALIILSIVIVLVSNKKKIDKASEPVDRTKVPVSVTIAKAQYTTLNVQAAYPAVTQPYEEAMLYAQTSGLITYLNVSLGQAVHKGQVLGTLDTKILKSNLQAAQIASQSAKINAKKLRDDYQRAKDLYENKAGLEVNMISAKNSYDNAQNNLENSLVQIRLMNEQIANANIVAPVSGIVSVNKVKQGEFVSPATPIATISNIAMVKATAYVSQQLAYTLKLNDTAAISSPLFPGAEIFGKIIFISPTADANHNYRVDLLVRNNGKIQLKGGTDIQVSFEVNTQKNALTIPKTALNTDETQPYVYVAENGKAVKKTVKTGIMLNDNVEILSGLTAGETVITGGQINLMNGSYIQITK
ncbi:efflux RND transporter periplasmic adaptor subunit [uncultured Chryseobacterium sp.]|uniref:efflux RND transporter periplasmic adaptor subunit n=1 Tax=uncultured Chryseobacterium sp. TaxID=259322 RepID=UPI0025909E9E|nr:efflux RND transporter periplasmic adaptor subunit [uncultured Chryseobacterium sp.]